MYVYIHTRTYIHTNKTQLPAEARPTRALFSRIHFTTLSFDCLSNLSICFFRHPLRERPPTSADAPNRPGFPSAGRFLSRYPGWRRLPGIQPYLLQAGISMLVLLLLSRWGPIRFLTRRDPQLFFSPDGIDAARPNKRVSIGFPSGIIR